MSSQTYASDLMKEVDYRQLRVLGVDPGRNGGLVILDGHRQIIARHTIPLSKETKKIDMAKLFKIVSSLKLCYSTAYIEKVHSMPRDSRQAAFTFGMNYGCLYMALVASGNPIIEVTPQSWMKVVHPVVGVAQGVPPKERSLKCVRKLFRGIRWLKNDQCRVPHDGLIDAALIACYGLSHKYGIEVTG